MLRAVGMTRRQVRGMIRQESVITAMIGAVLGMVLGLFLAALVTGALSSEGVVFSSLVISLIVFLVIGVIAGIVARDLPGSPRRAAERARGTSVRVAEPAATRLNKRFVCA